MQINVICNPARPIGTDADAYTARHTGATTLTRLTITQAGNIIKRLNGELLPAK